MRRPSRLSRPKMILAALLTSVLAAPAFAQTAGVPTDGAIGFQEPATPVMVMLKDFHDHFLIPITFAIVIFVLVLMAYIMWRFREKKNPVPSKTSHNTAIEIIWTVVPVLILLVMVVPSMQLLYFQDRIPEYDMTIKATGDTWAWNYAYPDFEDNVEEFVSNVLEEEDAKAEGVPYLLASDAPLVVPVDTVVKVLVTSNNNMHSWTVPSFGIKMDAVPGIINETWFEVTKPGTYYGQCSEICGIRHAYMPIHVEAVSKEEFARWVVNGGSFDAPLAELDVPQLDEPTIIEAASADALPK